MRVMAILVGALLSLAVLPARAQPLPEIQTVAVPANGATVTGQVGPGGRTLYYVAAQSLQALAVNIASPGNNAVFQVYAPGAQITQGSDGKPAIAGTTLSDAGVKDASMAWMGVVPQSGLCLIAVDSKGGAASFTLTIQLQ